MLFPLGTDHHDSKIGVVSLVIILLCFAVHLFVHPNTKKTDEAIENLYTSYWEDITENDSIDILEYLTEQVLAAESLAGEDGASYGEMMSALAAGETDDEAFQAKVDSIQQNSILFKGGLVKKNLSIWSLITHMFLHSDWLHLLGNLWFFYIVGIMMERYWGAGKFLLFYILIGIFSGLGFIVISELQGADIETIPLVGASGAIAGMMGALFATNRHIRVKLFYWFGFRVGTFDLTMGWYLGIYFVGQLFYGLLLGKYSATAYMAHVAGFALGAIFGWLIHGKPLVASVSEEYEDSLSPARTLEDLPQVAGGAPRPKSFADLPQVAGGNPKPKSFADLPQVAGGGVPQSPQFGGGSQFGNTVQSPQFGGGSQFGNMSQLAQSGSNQFSKPTQSLQFGATQFAAPAGAPQFGAPQVNQTQATGDAWQVLRSGNSNAATQMLVEKIDFHLKDQLRFQRELDGEIDKIYKAAKQLTITPDTYYNWAMTFAMGNMKKSALLCYELAAQFTADNLEFRMKSILKSAELRVDTGLDTARAAKFLNFVIQHDTKGLLRNEAEFYLAKLN